MSSTNTRGHDGRPWSRFVALALAVTVVASLLAVGPVSAQEDQQTFIVEQGGQCIQITPLGDGSQTVEEFYDYRSPDMEQTGLYSSYGTGEIQKSQVSQIFIYHGSKGLSLVFLHDKFGDGGGGFVATADITGLPPEGKWVVEDDTYTNRNDVFEYSNGSAHIVWGSNGNRTDGAAFRGLRSPNYTTITIKMQFNEESSNYPYPEWEGPPEQNEIERWIVRSGTGETFKLDMDKPVKISPGTCSGGISTFTPAPTDSPTATDTPGTTATTVPTPPMTTGPTPTTAQTTPTTTATPTPTLTVTPTATPTPTQTTTTATQTEQQTTTTATTGNETSETTGTNDSGGTTTQASDGGGSGVFGPGFGVGLALMAVLALAVLALARRDN